MFKNIDWYYFFVEITSSFIMGLLFAFIYLFAYEQFGKFVALTFLGTQIYFNPYSYEKI